MERQAILLRICQEGKNILFKMEDIKEIKFHFL